MGYWLANYMLHTFLKGYVQIFKIETVLNADLRTCKLGLYPFSSLAEFTNQIISCLSIKEIRNQCHKVAWSVLGD